MKKIVIIAFWIFSIIVSIIWSYEHPEKIESLKDSFKKNKSPEIKNQITDFFKIEILKEIYFL